MKIDKIELENFISHEKSTVQFKGEVNVILGPNGAGKSSIIDGIVFAMFREKSRGVLENFIKRGASRSKVSLTLSRGNDVIIIKRNLSRGSGSIEDHLLVNNKPITYGAENVTSELEKYLGIDKDIALSTIIVRQGELDKILDEFQNTIGGILKLEAIDKLIDSKGPIANLIKQLESKLEGFNVLKSQYNQIRDRLKEKQDKVKELENYISSLSNEIANLESSLGQVNKELDEYEIKRENYIKIKTSLDEKNKSFEEIEREIKRLENETRNISELEKEVEQLEKLRELKNNLDRYLLLKDNYDSVSKSINDLQVEIDEYEKSLRKKRELEPFYIKYTQLYSEKKRIDEEYNRYIQLKSKIASKEQTLEKYKNDLANIQFNEKNLEEVEKNIKEFENQKSELDRKLGQIQNGIKEADEIIKNITQVKSDRCPICGRPLDDEHRQRVISEYTEKRDSLVKEKERTEENLRELTNKLNKLRLEQKRIMSEKGKFDKIKMQIEELEDELSKLKQEISKYGNIEDRRNEVNNELEKLKDYYDNYLKLSKYDESSLSDKKRRIEELLNKKKQIEGELRKLENEVKGLNKFEIERRIEELEKKKKSLDDLRRKRAILEEDLKKKENLEKEIEKLKQKLEEISFDEDYYQELKKKVENLDKFLDERRNMKSKIEGELSSLKKEIEDMNTQMVQIESKLGEETKITNAISKLTRIREALGEKRLQSYIIMATKQVIENNLNDIISKFDLSIKNAEIEISPKRGKSNRGDYIIVYTNSGDQLPVTSLSGGEKMALALGLRLAIARSLMSDANFFILDEPTVHLDEDRRNYLIEIIKNLKEVVPQIIVVTHDREIENAADYVINVEKKGNKSVVSEANDN
ncbi:hypothetical protein BFU36_10205 [Sulfolobus sp. A20]|uniref:AAA family ATPase n=1 Tax=Sulfolobaceae TaxID=118883 RepID=UPI000845C504|nr:MULTISPECIES: SMC family ATPase [unclassified Sulfolobus]AOL17018.1 hypothetical protein BFU36_10205 [Sulfolobus sp. A20]TRM97301.1 SMC family ATPase [Sulfolobus sp. B1]TRM99598.1 SMC family ATPase [Sulfolobus sp. F1]TRN04130.1 SMC family ATPase [Sulfolobus sp. E1]